MKCSLGVSNFLEEISESEVAQSCLTLCDPMDCSLPGSSLHGILQARVLEWIAISFSRGSPQPRDRTHVSRIAGRRFNFWDTRKALVFPILLFSSISLHWSLKICLFVLISTCYSLEFWIPMDLSFLFSFAFRFSSFVNYLEGLLRQPFGLFTLIAASKLDWKRILY